MGKRVESSWHLQIQNALFGVLLLVIALSGAIASEARVRCPQNASLHPADDTLCLCDAHFEWNKNRSKCIPKGDPRDDETQTQSKAVTCRRTKPNGQCLCPSGYVVGGRGTRTVCVLKE